MGYFEGSHRHLGDQTLINDLSELAIPCLLEALPLFGDSFPALLEHR